MELAGAAALTPPKKSAFTPVTFSSSVPSSLPGAADPWSQTSWAPIRPRVPTLCARSKSFVPHLPQLGDGYNTCPRGSLPLCNELSHGRLPKQCWVSILYVCVSTLFNEDCELQGSKWVMEDHHYLEQITGMYVSTHLGLNFFRQIFKFSLFCLNTFTKKEKTVC